MSEIFKTKIRQIGTSAGVLIPQEKLIGLGIGDEIEMVILSHVKDFSGFGLARSFGVPFRRDKKVRTFS